MVGHWEGGKFRVFRGPRGRKKRSRTLASRNLTNKKPSEKDIHIIKRAKSIRRGGQGKWNLQ